MKQNNSYFWFPETELEPQSKGYIGKEKDKENNLGDHGVRKYDSQIGRFTSTEPLYEKYFGWSPYQYCGNNPVINSDPSGEQFITFGIDPIWFTFFEESAVIPIPPEMTIPISIPPPALPPGPVIVYIPKSKPLTPQDATNVDYPKPLEASKGKTNDGTTSSGSKTDEWGNKLGPSGKPQVNTVKHPNEKKAKDAARKEGKGKPVKHTNPKKGGNHYHPSDQNGDKLPNSTHHQYPG